MPMSYYQGEFIDLRATEEMQSAAAQAREWAKSDPSSLSGLSRSVSDKIINGDELDPDTVKRIEAYFRRNAAYQDSDGFTAGDETFPNRQRTAWDLLGGDAARVWAKARVAEFEKIDSRLPSSVKAVGPSGFQKAARGLLFAVLAWTFFVFGEGIYVHYSIANDLDGSFAWQLVGADGLTGQRREEFLASWQMPMHRSAFVSSFVPSFWTVRLLTWLAITVPATLIALVLSRLGPAEAVGGRRI